MIKIKNLITFLMFISIIPISGCEFIINKLAFFPNTRDTLSVEQLPSGVEEKFISTADRVKLQCYLIRHKHSNRILIYFHGNAGNITHRIPDLLSLHGLGLNVLGVGYRGYGKSNGKPSEQGIYSDGDAAVKYARHELGFKESQIILLGRSIGSTVATHTAQYRKIAGLILVTPLTSGREFARSQGFGPLSFLAGDSFDNLSKIIHIQCQLLIIHGTKDEVIPLEMGKNLFQQARVKKHWVQIQGANHNNLSRFPDKKYWKAIKAFVDRLNRSNP